jgi:hypothetical protein
MEVFNLTSLCAFMMRNRLINGEMPTQIGDNILEGPSIWLMMIKPTRPLLALNVRQIITINLILDPERSNKANS